MMTKGKRYSKEEKSEVVDFVKAYNEENGRGGVANATKRFGITAMTIKAWMDRDHYSSVGQRSVKRGTSSNVFQQLADLHSEITEKEAELAALKETFATLKQKAEL